MKTYVVLEPAGGGRTAANADAVRFVREKFYWAALLLTLPWLIWHRLWLALLVWLLASGLIAAVGYAMALDPTVVALMMLVPPLILAFEGSELRRRKLLREGYRDAGTAIGSDLEDAERRFFANWQPRNVEKSKPADPPRPPAPPPAARPAPSSVIGVFPQPGGGR